jgi:hypothetical protein
VNQLQQSGVTTQEKMERALIGGDLKDLTPEERVQYYNAVCKSLGLNPLTKPFAYLNLSGKTTLYALKDCTEQLRSIHGISLSLTAREAIEGVYIVTAKASRPDGRTDESTGAVPIEGTKGEARANAYLKAETKAKRRVTLSICGLGLLDESEVEAIQDARPYEEPQSHAELQEALPVHRSASVRTEGKSHQIAPDVPPPVAEMYKEMLQKGGISRVFQTILGDMADAAGETDGGKMYTETLREFGVQSFSQFKSMQKAQQCVLALYNKLANLGSTEAIETEAVPA